MDLDFVLFNPPKIKYNFIDLWGEVIFLPKLRKKAKINQQSFSLFNCYNPSTISDVNLTHEAALL